MNNKALFGVLLASSFALSSGCDNDQTTAMQEPVVAAVESESYKVTRDQVTTDNTRIVEVQLPKRLDKAALNDLTQALYQDGYEHTSINYRIKDDGNAAYWATANFSPELVLNIVGSSVEEHARVQAQTVTSPNAKIVGTWLANLGTEYKIFIYTEGDRIFIESKDADGISRIKELYSENVGGQKRLFDDASREHGEYFVIGQDGKLEFWSQDDNFYTAPKA